jgi:hypothetical protein
VIFTTQAEIYAVYGVKVVENDISTEIRPVLYRRCGRGHVLALDILEFFFVLKSTYIVHSAQFVYLSQSEFGLAKLAKLRLTVIVLNILVSCRILLKKLK